jgi:hypothetical protein
MEASVDPKIPSTHEDTIETDIKVPHFCSDLCDLISLILKIFIQKLSNFVHRL